MFSRSRKARNFVKQFEAAGLKRRQVAERINAAETAFLRGLRDDLGEAKQIMLETAVDELKSRKEDR